MDKIIVTTPTELVAIIQDSISKAIKEQSQKEAFPANPILSIDEASKYLNLAKQTLYAFTSKREIPFLKRGKKLYFRKADLELWLMEGKKKSIFEIKKDLDRK